MDDQGTNREGGGSISRRRFQFNLRNMLVAMTWMVLWAAWLGLSGNYFSSPTMLSRHRWFVLVVGNSLTIGLPIVAIAALFGRTKRGLIILAMIMASLLCLATILHLYTTIL